MNGDLIVTHQDFTEYGIRQASIAQAIRELEYYREPLLRKKELTANVGDAGFQAAFWFGVFSNPSMNVMPSMTFGN